MPQASIISLRHVLLPGKTRQRQGGLAILQYFQISTL